MTAEIAEVEETAFALAVRAVLAVLRLSCGFFLLLFWTGERRAEQGEGDNCCLFGIRNREREIVFFVLFDLIATVVKRDVWSINCELLSAVFLLCY